MSGQDDHPLSIFREAFASVFGRMLAFVVACSLAAGACLLVGFLLGLIFGTHSFGISDWTNVDLFHLAYLTVGLPLVWISIVGIGVFQGWGFVSYGILAALYVGYAKHDWPASHILPAAFLVQHLETMRCLCQADGWRSAGSAEVIVNAALWVLAAAAYVAYLLRTHERRPLLGG
jgi:hypothetical protein